MYEIIANPKDYGIESLIKGTSDSIINFDPDSRTKWSQEIDLFENKLNELTAGAKRLKSLLSSDENITGTSLSIKTLKVQMFKMDNHINEAIELSGKIESEIKNI